MNIFYIFFLLIEHLLFMCQSEVSSGVFLGGGEFHLVELRVNEQKLS